MRLHPSRRLLLGIIITFSPLAFVACGDDSTDSTATPAPTQVPNVPRSDGPPGPVGEPSTEAPTTTEAPATTTPHSGHDEGAMPIVAVNAVDYEFENLPASVPAGTQLSLTNTSSTELHEIVAFRIPDAEQRSLLELMTLPPDEFEAAIATGLPSLVMLAPPGEEAFPALGDGTLTEPGRYAVLCAIPIGADPEEYLEKAQTSDGPPEVEGGPPHFTAGMWAELVVEPA